MRAPTSPVARADPQGYGDPAAGAEKGDRMSGKAPQGWGTGALVGAVLALLLPAGAPVPHP